MSKRCKIVAIMEFREFQFKNGMGDKILGMGGKWANLSKIFPALNTCIYSLNNFRGGKGQLFTILKGEFI